MMIPPGAPGEVTPISGPIVKGACCPAKLVRRAGRAALNRRGGYRRRARVAFGYY